MMLYDTVWRFWKVQKFGFSTKTMQLKIQFTVQVGQKNLEEGNLIENSFSRKVFPDFTGFLEFVNSLKGNQRKTEIGM